MKYKILVSYDTNKVFPSMGTIVNKVNDHMQGFGFSEKIFLRTELMEMSVITAERELTNEELETIVEKYTIMFSETFPGSNPEVKIV